MDMIIVATITFVILFLILLWGADRIPYFQGLDAVMYGYAGLIFALPVVLVVLLVFPQYIASMLIGLLIAGAIYLLKVSNKN